MNANNIMLDYETLSVAVNPVILSIGATRFDPHKGIVAATIEINIDPESYRAYSGFDISLSTVFWWLKQSKEVQDALTSKPCVPLRVALLELSDFMQRDGEPVVWSNDETADILWLKSAWTKVFSAEMAFKEILPWTYRNQRCFRTVRDIAESLKIGEHAKDLADSFAAGPSHSAGSDSRWQAAYVSYVYSHFHGRL